jgi:3-dehydroquinate dehydratase II
LVRIAVIHGPNLNLLGLREPEIYGGDDLDRINLKLQELAKRENLELRIVQSNHEGGIVDAIHAALDWAQAIVINPAAYTHTSVAIRDAIAAVRLPTVEVHLSNIYSREEFRHRSLVSPVVVGQISGFGTGSYLLALLAAKWAVEANRH